MSKFSYVLIVSTVVALSACGDNNSGAQAKRSNCFFPDIPTEAAPNWICDEQLDGVTVGAVGVHEKTAAGVQFQKDMAAVAARVNLAQVMKVHVQNKVQRFAQTTGAGSPEAVEKFKVSVSQRITAKTISGARVFNSISNSKGTMYVFVGLDAQLADDAVMDVVKASMNNDKALWQQLRGKKSQDELATEIAKMNDK